MFDKMKALMDAQRKMQEVKRELDNTSFETASSDGLIKITMNGSQEVREVRINPQALQLDITGLEKTLKDVYNRSIKRSHELAAQKMKDITGLNLPGLT